LEWVTTRWLVLLLQLPLLFHRHNTTINSSESPVSKEMGLFVLFLETIVVYHLVEIKEDKVKL